MTALHASGGGVKYAWRKVSILLDKWKIENVKWKIFTRHCEVCEARRGNPVEQRLNPLDCFTTFAMTVNPSKLLNCEEGGTLC